MPLNIRSEIVNQLAERLAARKQVNKTDAVRIALENELRRLNESVPLRDRLRPLQERIMSRPATGLEADKAFYDELSGNLDVRGRVRDRRDPYMRAASRRARRYIGKLAVSNHLADRDF